jgi:uncharacterized membrane protein YciS (DUF1049 family)
MHCFEVDIGVVDKRRFKSWYLYLLYMLTATNDELVSFNFIIAYLTTFLACIILGFFFVRSIVLLILLTTPTDSDNQASHTTHSYQSALVKLSQKMA